MAAESLQSKEHRSLLDIVDKLRSLGIDYYVDLPQIIVCGDQSSGKSSVLEAISGMSFPSKDNLCTRFTTELILRCSPTKAVNVSIRAGQEKSSGKLSEFSPVVSPDELDLGQVINDAKEAMGISSKGGKNFSTDILCVELSGPTQPHLTMVDLPGLFNASTSEQSEADAKLVRRMVYNYMSAERCIILAVVSAKSDFALQEVTKFSRKLDPQGKRTIGLITKPDTLDQGSDSEKAYVNMAQNKDVKLELGWHVLRNRDFSMKDATNAERDEVERKFFAKGAWSVLDRAQLGIDALRPRLSKILRNQILTHLPSVLEDVENEVARHKASLQKMGTPRGNIREQRQYLFIIALDFSKLLQESVRGSYDTPGYFGDPNTDEGGRRRLRAVVQKEFMEFKTKMHSEGHAEEIVDYADPDQPRQISRGQYIYNVKKLIERSRGCELPVIFNPDIINDLFREQSQPWRGLVNAFVDRLLDLITSAVSSALQYTADKVTASKIERDMINPQLEMWKSNVRDKVNEMLIPYCEGHAITYNDDMAHAVQQAKAKRCRASLEGCLKRFFRVDSKGLLRTYATEHSIVMKDLVDKLTKNAEADMDDYAGSSAADVMEAYYTVALKKLIDDLSTLVFEQCLMQKLPTLFSPQAASNLTDDDVRIIAAERRGSRVARSRLSEKLAQLEQGLQELQQLEKHKEAGLGIDDEDEDMDDVEG